MKRLISIALIIAQLMSILTLSAFAIEKYPEDRIANSDAKIVSVLVLNGKSYPLTQAEQDKLYQLGLDAYVSSNPTIEYEPTTTHNVISPQNQPGDINTYYERIGYNFLNRSEAVRVTPYTVGPASISYGNSVSISATFSTGLSSMGKKAVLKALGAEFSLTVETAHSFGIDFPVSSGYTGYVEFTPLMRHTEGTYSYDSFTETEVSADIPQKVNGFADGEYRLVQTPV